MLRVTQWLSTFFSPNLYWCSASLSANVRAEDSYTSQRHTWRKLPPIVFWPCFNAYILFPGPQDFGPWMQWMQIASFSSEHPVGSKSHLKPPSELPTGVGSKAWSARKLDIVSMIHAVSPTMHHSDARSFLLVEPGGF